MDTLITYDYLQKVFFYQKPIMFNAFNNFDIQINESDKLKLYYNSDGTIIQSITGSKDKLIDESIDELEDSEKINNEQLKIFIF